MDKRLKTAEILALMFLMVAFHLSLIEVSKAAAVGVKVGDWAKYSVTAEYNSQNPNPSIPMHWQDAKNTQWENVTVQKISGTNITIQVTTAFANYTQKSALYWGDITGLQGDDEFGFYIIPAGLGQGDTVRQSAVSINYTMSKEYAGQTREVDFAEISITAEGFVFYGYYWDKQTGILTASWMQDNFSEEGYDVHTALQKKLTETNLWQPRTETPQPWTVWGIPLIAVSGILVTAVLIMTRPKNKRKRRNKVR